MSIIHRLRALEILDSRGRPTVKVMCELSSGHRASASVPSGASRGSAEAVELRDKDLTRYQGMGCRRAVENVNHLISRKVAKRNFEGQEELDRFLIALDGTANKSRLGANAILATSIAFARAEAAARDTPLFEHFAPLAGAQTKPRLPRPIINLFSGGLHAGNQVPVQDVLIVPSSANSIGEVLAVAYDVYQAAAAIIMRKYAMRPLKADEGGLAPPFPNVQAMLDNAVEAIEEAGYAPGRDVFLALDVAASQFFRNGAYDFEDRPLSSREMIETIVGWMDRYPIISVEDGLDEDDWTGWPLLRERADGRANVVGDDLLCTDAVRIEQAVREKAADTLLLKVNQVGTLTEAARAGQLARSAGWDVTVSARSGETEDDWLADLAVGWAADQVKIGSIMQSERLAKYNRLLEIEEDFSLELSTWPRRAALAEKISEHPGR